MLAVSLDGPLTTVVPPLSGMTVDELSALWDQMIRNRNHATVVKIVQEQIPVELNSEVRLLGLYKELMSRGRDPLT